MKKKNVSHILWRDLFPVMFTTREYYKKVVGKYYEGFNFEQKLLQLVLDDVSLEQAKVEFYTQIRESFRYTDKLDENLNYKNIDNFLSYVFNGGELELEEIPEYYNNKGKGMKTERRKSLKEILLNWF